MLVWAPWVVKWAAAGLCWRTRSEASPRASSSLRGGEIPRRRQSRLPVSIPVKFRLVSTAAFQDGAISEISVGGAMLNTQSPLPLDSDIVLEVVPPGGAAALEISGKVSYHVPGGATGVKFMYRDGDGSRRLRELVRRLRAS